MDFLMFSKNSNGLKKFLVASRSPPHPGRNEVLPKNLILVMCLARIISLKEVWDHPDITKSCWGGGGGKQPKS